MAITGKGFDSDPITEAEWSYLASTQGVHTSGLEVTAASGTRVVDVATGWANIVGYYFKSDSVVQKTLAANTSGLPRIDVICAAVTWANNTKDIVVAQGTPAATPVAPALTQTPGYWWRAPLAEVYVANGATTISAGNVTDRRIFGGPVIQMPRAGIRPDVSQRAVIIETDTNRILASNGSSYGVVQNQRQRGRASTTIASGDTVSSVNTITFPTAFASTPYVQLTPDDSRVNVSIGSISTTQVTWYARWVITGSPSSNLSVSVDWAAES